MGAQDRKAVEEVVIVVVALVLVCVVYLALGLWVIATIFPTPPGPASEEELNREETRP